MEGDLGGRSPQSLWWGTAHAYIPNIWETCYRNMQIFVKHTL